MFVFFALVYFKSNIDILNCDETKRNMKRREQDILQKSPLLKVTGKNLLLVNRLLAFFGAETLQALPAKEGPARKRARLQLPSSDGDRGGENDEEEEGEEEENGAEKEGATLEPIFEKNFKFSRAGQLVAVFNVEDFFIGEVKEVESPECAQVHFLERTKTLINGSFVFRWPSKRDVADISSDVVFCSNIVFSPCSSTRRAFVVEEPADIQKMYYSFSDYMRHNLL